MKAMDDASEAVRLRFVADVNPRVPEFDQLPDDAEISFLPLESIWPGGRLDTSRTREKSEVATGYTRFRDGDILVPKITPTFEANRSVIAHGLVGGIGSGTTELHVLRPRPAVDARYLLYCLSSARFLGEGEASMYGVAGQQRVPDRFIRDFPIRFLPLQEQRRIADFLDAEVARIDKVIAAEQARSRKSRERLIAVTETAVLGRSRTAAAVNEPEGPLRPVPQHWRFRRNKTFMREVIQLSQTGQEELLTVSHLTGVSPRSEKTVYMFLAESNEGYKRVRRNDLVINTMWAWMGALGVSPHDGIVSPAYGVYRFTSVDADPRYFDALFRTPAYVAEMTRYSTGVWTSRLRLYPESFLGLRSPFPPLREQRTIADSIEEVRSEQNRLETLIARSVDLLLERRQALITAVVAGELDVSGVSA